MTQKGGVKISMEGRLTWRELAIFVSLLLGGSNLFWCWTHEKEIRELRQRATVQIHKMEAMKQ